MAKANLTRTKAQERAALLETEHYLIELDLTGASETTFESKTTVAFRSKNPGAETFIELIAEEVRSATLNGAAVDVSAYSQDKGLVLSNLAEHNELVVDAVCRYSRSGQGLHRFVDPADNSVYLYTQFETADAKRMFACFDQPDLKAVFELKVKAPAEWEVVSNAELASVEEDGALRVFAPTKRLSTYLVALVAGPYAKWTDSYEDEHGTIPLGVYCRSSLAESMDVERVVEQTKQGFGFYHKHFGFPYPFGKYDQLFVPEFNAGAMENAGCVTFTEEYVFRSKVTQAAYERRCETILHEMAHMWFGDLVTMRWWDDLWLNESFATFASVLCQAEATEYADAWTTFASAEKAWAYRQDNLPSTHPIAADIPDVEAVEVNFDGITYAKGASVLKQLFAYVGREPFLAGLREYFQTHAYGNAEFKDLVASLEKSSGRDLSGWGGQWLKTTGINPIGPSFELDGEGRYASFAVEQGGAAPGAGETRTHRLAVGVYGDEDGRLVRAKRVELDVEGARAEVAELAGAPAGKLVLVNDDDLTYCSLRLDPRSLETLKTRIADIAEPLPRALAWSAAWEMTRDARMKARDFLVLVEQGVAAETDVGVQSRLLQQALVAVNSYADPQWAKDEGYARLAQLALRCAQGAPAGSDSQLAFVNALTSSVLGPDEARATRILISGSDPSSVGLPGLVVDTDLRWRLTISLAAAGEVDSDGTDSPIIDAAQANDKTSKGAQQAAQARAARPQPEVKAQTWERIMREDDLANTTLRALIAGFAFPGQQELLEDYTTRYFEEIPSVWEERTGEVGRTIAAGLYPSWSISDASVGLADEFLSRSDLSPGLRRLVLEGQDGVRRSLRASVFDAEA
ncbi:aminopeptidase N [Segniliparus rotundus DSM 44985]|uniref:Aminopeptidase N n=1 Tax=Segniliparus rotundus (strain ATCC BAA-972 / CDC 1076 / CIP 108378 / DSM 44985 / JCM 13578) TaxID=640132 RepID=D6Z8T1_SEGRD|nr:aminopeptidase N [Segniliparus rotundus]ADG98361.1 aminopeptidase N [Segniliparus rotundus DSM 44985]